MKKEQIDLLNEMIIFYWQNNNIPNNQYKWNISQEIIKQLTIPVVVRQSEQCCLNPKHRADITDMYEPYVICGNCGKEIV